MGGDRGCARILTADDDPAVVEGLALLLESEGHEVVRASDGDAALAAVRERSPDVAFLDLRMPGPPTLELVARMLDVDPALPVVVITGFGTIENTVAAMRAGAYDFLEKPVRREVLLPLTERALAHRRMRREIDRLREALGRKTTAALLGESETMVRLREDVLRVAANARATALVLGESGTGKELVARAIHECGPRARGPWVAVNCAALSAPLLEAELFGYERGAFTGASPGGREGLFEQAEGGTLFLDEVGELEIGLQAKLLRALEERRVRRLGGSADLAVDLRVVAASNRDLLAEKEAGRFRSDLYYRIAVVTLRVAPLRERGDDARLLARAFLEQLRGAARLDFTPEAEEAIREHSWPGNVRELRNAVERAVITARGARITPEDLALGRSSSLSLPASALPASARIRPLADVERELIEAALAACGGNVSRAARLLGVHRTTLHRKREELRREEHPSPSLPRSKS